MLQLMCGEIYIPIPLMHRERGFTVELLNVAYSTSHSASAVEIALRRILRDRIFVFEDGGSVYGPYGELDDNVLEFCEDDWTAQLPVALVEMIPVVESTPPKCFRCALAAYMTATIAQEDLDTHVEILGVNVVRTPGRDVLGRMGMKRALVEPVQALTIRGTSVYAMSGFRIGYVEEEVKTEIAAPYLILDIRAHGGDVELPAHKFSKLEHRIDSVGSGPLARAVMASAHDFSRAMEEYGEPAYEFTIATNGAHAFRLIK